MSFFNKVVLAKRRAPANQSLRLRKTVIKAEATLRHCKQMLTSILIYINTSSHPNTTGTGVARCRANKQLRHMANKQLRHLVVLYVPFGICPGIGPGIGSRSFRKNRSHASWISVSPSSPAGCSKMLCELA